MNILPEIPKDQLDHFKVNVKEWLDTDEQIKELEKQIRELKSRRNVDPKRSGHPHGWPSRLDPFYGFASYPTKKIDLQNLLYLSDPDSDTSIRQFRQLIKLEMVNYVLNRMSPQRQLESVLVTLGTSSATVENIILSTCTHADEQQKLLLSITWMVKLGLIRVKQ